VLERIIGLVAPHQCYICKREGALLCEWCAQDCCLPLSPRCYHCYALNPGSAVCNACRHRSPLKHVWARTDYEIWAKQLLHDFKFSRAQAAAETIGQLMSRGMPYLPRDTLVMSVPTATSRRRQRGYDHAALLGKQVARQLGLPYAPALHRLGQARQVGADKHTRETQLITAFRLTNASLVVGSKILLVDDIITTGASLESCARLLKASGADRVDAVVFAQKQ